MSVLHQDTLDAASGLIFRFMGDVDVERLDVRIENSPWVSFDVWVHMRGEYKFALWRSSGDVFAVDASGAAGDEPVASLAEALA
jgi:hypothetical protein